MRYSLFVFFKQKTAYEMRISDWSSDVCSSDLLLHEVTSPQAFAGLAEAGRAVRWPERALALSDHNVPTAGQAAGLAGVSDGEARAQLEALVENTRRFGIENFPMGDPRGGIVHVVGPEQGRSQPGMTIV